MPVKEGENIERALKKFKRKYERTGVLKELRRRQYFTKPSVAKREAMQRAIYVERTYRNEEYLIRLPDIRVAPADFRRGCSFFVARAGGGSFRLRICLRIRLCFRLCFGFRVEGWRLRVGTGGRALSVLVLDGGCRSLDRGFCRRPGLRRLRCEGSVVLIRRRWTEKMCRCPIGLLFAYGDFSDEKIVTKGIKLRFFV